MKIKFKKTHEKAKMPKKAHEGDAAFDLYSLDEYLLLPQTVTMVHTGINLADCPKDNFFIKIESRSGLSRQCVFQVAGIVDSSYRGEICIMLYNGSKHSVHIGEGDRVAQFIPYSIFTDIEVEETDTLQETTRGEGGFGSTGTK